VAERVLQCQARYGIPAGVQSMPGDLKDPEWSVATGLAMYSAKLKSQTEKQHENAGWLAKILK
jgi:cell division protein FtsA